jgi:hypothetical protein
MRKRQLKCTYSCTRRLWFLHSLVTAVAGVDSEGVTENPANAFDNLKKNMSR